jgi:hypothetical protein
MVEWDSIYELFDLIANDDPILCAECAIKNDILGTSGPKRVKRFGQVKRTLKLLT